MKRRIPQLFTLAVATLWSLRVHAQTTGASKTPADPLPEWAQTFEEFLTWDIFDIPVWRIVLCVLILMLGLILKNGLINRILRPVERLLNRTETNLDNALLESVRRPGSWLVFVFSVWLAIEVLQLPPGLSALTTVVLQTLGTGVVAWMVFLAIDVAGMALQKFVDQTESDIDDHIVPLVKRVLRMVLVIFALVMIVQQWGYDVTSLVAGLGIGGIAFALAAQNTLANWFGSLMIFTDRPFRLGDWVRSGSIEGIVEEVGLRSTKIRTFDKSLITVPNNTIANENCENFSMREQRRLNITIGLDCGTTHPQIAKILEELRAMLADQPLADPESVNVFFSGLGESTLDVMVMVFFKSNSWADYAPAREAVLLEIMRIVEENGSSLAFPSQSLYIETPIETRNVA